MATVLFAWELGGGLGHLMRLAPLAKELAKKGHKLFLATRDLPGAYRTFQKIPIKLLAAPPRHQAAPVFPVPHTFAHILYNIGFNDDTCLRSNTEAWRNLYQLINPDLIIFDHSPFAMLAARGFSARTVVVGSGFFIPPDQYPWPSFRTWQPADLNALKQDEDRLLIRINEILKDNSFPLLGRLADLYSQVDESFLTTFHELDHYLHRDAARYWGIIGNSQSSGKDPVWPEGPGKKVYAYLKLFTALPSLLEYLNHLRLPSLIYIDQIDPKLHKHFSSPTLKFESEPLNLAKAGAMCDVAITNATLNTTATLLGAGKPVLAIPVMLEQGIIARRVQAQGAGLEALVAEPEMIKQSLRKLLDIPSYTRAAEQLAVKFSAIDPTQQLGDMILRIEQLI